MSERDETIARALAQLSDHDRDRILALLLLDRLGPDKLRLALPSLEQRRVEAQATRGADEAAALENLRAVLADAVAYVERYAGRPGGEPAGGFLRDLGGALARVVLGVDIPARRERDDQAGEALRQADEAAGGGAAHAYQLEETGMLRRAVCRCGWESKSWRWASESADPRADWAGHMTAVGA